MKTSKQIPNTPKRFGSGARSKSFLLGLGAASLLLSSNLAHCSTATWDFTTDPTTNAVNPIQVFQTGFLDSSGNSAYWRPAGGNPGGFLGVTWPIGSSSSIILFPDIDGGKLVTAFKLDTDLRVGSPQQVDRAADGFSINFARSNDPVFQNHSSGDFATGGAVETGTQTGLAISFDTWSGNTLPDGADIEGIIVRVDNATVLRYAMPTRNGQCADATSLQTGPRNTQYWTDVKAAGFDQSAAPDAAFAPDSWTNLCWQHLSVELDNASKLTVTWKGVTVLDHFQTTFFPSAGGLVLAGRTGNADEHTHFDNITLVTTASAFDTTPPTVPTNFVVTLAGSRRVELSWAPSFDASGRVAYTVLRDGVAVTGLLTSTNFVDYDVKPSTTYAYKVRATDVSLNVSGDASVSATTVAEVPGAGFLAAQIYDNVANADLGSLINDASYPNSPTRTRYVNGLSYGEPSFGNTLGENYGLRIATVLTAPETGMFRFFVRSDDASAVYINKTGPGIPDAKLALPDAQESDCCDAFQEPGVANDDGTSYATSEPISLTAGQQYGVLYLVKEGGGGDWGQVAMRKEGDNTPAASLQPIRGAFLSGVGDPVGASASITQNPQSATVFANEKVTFTFAGSASSPYIPSAGLTTPSWTQWFKNGNIIPGATSSSYTIPVVDLADNGAKFTAVIATLGAAATSAVATLTVNADTKKPTVVNVDGSETFTQLTVTFSEPVTAPTATTAANYSLSGGLVVSSPVLLDPFHVQLTTTAQGVATNYTLTVNNVQDNAGNAVAANSQFTFTTWGLLAGRVKIQRYNGFTGATISDLQAVVADPKYPNSPDFTGYLTSGMTFGQPAFGDTYGENYMARLTAVLIPKVSGQYNFFVRSDDASELFINKTGPGIPDAKTATPDAQEQDCCDAFAEPGADDNGDGTFPTSGPISLTAGQQYGILYLVKEGGGGDWGQVAMRLAGTTTPAAAALMPISDQVFSFGPPTPAGIISVNFQGRKSDGNGPTVPLAANDVAGVVPVANWNNVNDSVTTPTAEKGTTGPLNNSSGAATPVTLTFDANDSWNNDVDPATITTGNAKMMNGVIKQQKAGTSATFTFNNVPDGQYDVYVYVDSNNDNVALDLSDNNSGTTYYVIGQHQFANNASFVQAVNTNPSGTRDVGNYVKFSKVWTSGGQIIIGAKYISGGDGLGIAGLQIVAPAGSLVVAGPVIDSIRLQGGNVVITWRGTGTLQSASSVLGPYTDVTGASSPYSTAASAAAAYFRLRQ